MEESRDFGGERIPSSQEPSAAEHFAARLVSFHQFYRFLVIGCAAFCVGAVFIAVYVRVWIGLLVAIAVAGIYRYLLGDELRRQLGLRACRNDDGLTVGIRSAAVAEDGEFCVPGRLLWLDVTEWIGAEAEVESLEQIRVLRFCVGLCRIDAKGFDGMSALENVCFAGSEAEWNKIEKPDLPEGVKVTFGA